VIAEGEFDYVIAGGGTAGCVVAARLSEDPNVSVCLLEAGPSDVDDAAILRLEDWMYLLDSGYDWDYLVEPQEKGNSFLRHARAKVLCGCSSHNSCIAFWTPREDLDEWAAYLFIGLVALVGAIYYFTVYSRKPIEVLAEHRSRMDLAEPAIADVAP
jgi:choline dehydrogenase-like flavoprotein